MKKNLNEKVFSHVIRLRKGKKSLSRVDSIIVILNKKSLKSQGIVENLGFFQYGKKRLFSMNYMRLAYFLNKGFKLKKSIGRFILYNTAIGSLDNIKDKKYKPRNKRRRRKGKKLRK